MLTAVASRVSAPTDLSWYSLPWTLIGVFWAPTAVLAAMILSWMSTHSSVDSCISGMYDEKGDEGRSAERKKVRRSLVSEHRTALSCRITHLKALVASSNSLVVITVKDGCELDGVGYAATGKDAGLEELLVVELGELWCSLRSIPACLLKAPLRTLLS